MAEEQRTEEESADEPGRAAEDAVSSPHDALFRHVFSDPENAVARDHPDETVPDKG